MAFKRLIFLLPLVALLTACASTQPVTGASYPQAPVAVELAAEEPVVAVTAPEPAPVVEAPVVEAPVVEAPDCQRSFTFGESPKNRIIHIEADAYGCPEFADVVSELTETAEYYYFTDYTIAFDGPLVEDEPYIMAEVTAEGLTEEQLESFQSYFYDEAGEDSDYFSKYPNLEE